MARAAAARSIHVDVDDADEGSGRAATGSQTLLRGLDVIDALIEGPLALAELSEHLDLTRSTTHRLASALVERRLLSFRPREGYSLGPKLLELGYAAREQMHLPRIARPHLERLSSETEDTVHLGVLDGTTAFYLDKVPGTRRVSIGSRVGERHPIAATGLGKALILDMDEEQWASFFDVGDPDQTRPGRAVWLERMRSYAAQGYAFDLEENEDRIRCVAAPIRGVDGQIVAALSVSSAAQYMKDTRMQSLTKVVTSAAQAISEDLGWNPKKTAKKTG
ncbi:transcriptional regulator [Brevundimonas sp. Leaf363]|uniref:IclR family transcriptional regulator n=1 Tax=Brevundimonas sp. Leaf363 TaxID=1736353 RepID=UPI000701F0CE|nr:IclR family transcriptional regulator [Brevundimonas sp. Leaf363]KQS53817.1 transcriptional regulator [Brevundimonas sp. Leaf363]